MYEKYQYIAVLSESKPHLLGDFCSQLGQGQLIWDSNLRVGEFIDRQVIGKKHRKCSIYYVLSEFQLFSLRIMTKAPFTRRLLQSIRTRATNMGFKSPSWRIHRSTGSWNKHRKCSIYYVL